VLEEQIISKLNQRLGAECVLEEPFTKGNQIFTRINKKCLEQAIEFLKNNGFTHLSAITGLEVEDGIELLYHLSNGNTLVTVKVKLSKNEAVAPSITDIIRGATLYEQEIHDLFGVDFEGHPNLAPLILPDDWPKDVYPLRKSGTTKEGKLKKKQKHSRTNI
jgi:NADH:ubiquinone oxidoreductase subunit C